MDNKIKVDLEEGMAIPDVETNAIGETEEAKEERETREKIEELKEALQEPKQPARTKLNLDTVALPEVEVLLKHLK